MQWFDIGVNLLDKRFIVSDVIARASAQAVSNMCVISSDVEESIKASILVKAANAQAGYQQLVYTAGVHPHNADHFSASGLAQLKQLVTDTNMVAIGECGLDYNRNFSSKENQLKAFEAQLEFAAVHNKPVYLHERDAFDDQIKLLKTYLPRIPNAIVHCFTGSRRQLDAYLELGCYIGITGWLCDDKRGKELQDAVAYLPLDRLLLETDAPYLFPKNIKPRVKTNEPCFLQHVGNKVSQLKNIDVNKVSEATLQNAFTVFGLGLVSRNVGD